MPCCDEFVAYCQNFDFKIRRDHQKISYYHRDYEFVEEKSLSYGPSRLGATHGRQAPRHVRFRQASSDWRGSDSPSLRFLQHRRLTRWTAVRAKMRLGL